APSGVPGTARVSHGRGPNHLVRGRPRSRHIVRRRGWTRRPSCARDLGADRPPGGTAMVGRPAISSSGDVAELPQPRTRVGGAQTEERAGSVGGPAQIVVEMRAVGDRMPFDG